MQFGDYIIYADESGDHNLSTINPDNPSFVLAFCIFKKDYYAEKLVPKIQKLKFKYWGHDSVILHGHEIRKAKGDFAILLNPEVRQKFLAELNTIMTNADFTIIASAINKKHLSRQYKTPENPYEIALKFCLERLHYWLSEKNALQHKTHVVFEKRGSNEDRDLELEFRRIMDGRSFAGAINNLDIRLMDKKHNSTGLQIADLVAHPISRFTLNPNQQSVAFEAIKNKIRHHPNNKNFFIGYGLKIFP